MPTKLHQSLVSSFPVTVLTQIQTHACQQKQYPASLACTVNTNMITWQTCYILCYFSSAGRAFKLINCCLSVCLCVYLSGWKDRNLRRNCTLTKRLLWRLVGHCRKHVVLEEEREGCLLSALLLIIWLPQMCDRYYSRWKDSQHDMQEIRQ